MFKQFPLGHLKKGIVVTLYTAVAGCAYIALGMLLTLPVYLYAATTLTKASTVTGNASVIGTLSKGSGSFVIDHPLDPKNWLLVFSFVESPDAKNIYDGIATLNDRGEVEIELPDYFLPLNMSFRYLAEPIGSAMPDLHISTEVGRAYGFFGPPRFWISGGTPGGRVSWQVSGIRHDRFIRAYPIIPEVPKKDSGIVEEGECLFEPLCL